MKTEDKIKQAKTETFHRELRMETGRVDEDTRSVELAFSSEDPYRRWFGDEILGHSDAEVRMGRLNNAAALLVNHDSGDQVGVIESARVDKDGKGRATVRFGASARASEIYQDVKDGIRQLVSVGYRVHEMVLEKASEDADVYRVTDWEPHEISIVSVPADATVGVGRSDTDPTATKPEEIVIMDTEVKTVEPVIVPGIDHEVERKVVRDAETLRIRSLEALGGQFGQTDMARKHISDGLSVDAFIKVASEANADVRQASAHDIGMSTAEVKQFSVCRLLMAMAEPHNREAQRAGGFELEASAAAANAHAKTGAGDVRGAILPVDVMRASFAAGLAQAQDRGMVPAHLRDLTRVLSAGTTTDGEELVSTDLLSGNFIDVLRNRSMVMAAGATVLNGLVGNVAIPRKTSGAAGAWLATEGANAAVSDPQFDQVTLTPKTVAAYTSYTRQLLMQSSMAIESMVRMDLAVGLATTIDLAALYGTGSSGQPTGISQTSGINAPTAFAGAVPTYAEVVAMESAVAADNADMGALAYMMESPMRGSLKSTEKASGTAQFVWEPGGTVNGYAAHVTNQVTSGDIFFGNFADLLVGMWGGLDLLTDPYTGSKAGTIQISAFQSVDLGVRHPVSFAFNNDT